MFLPPVSKTKCVNKDVTDEICRHTQQRLFLLRAADDVSLVNGRLSDSKMTFLIAERVSRFSPHEHTAAFFFMCEVKVAKLIPSYSRLKKTFPLFPRESVCVCVGRGRGGVQVEVIDGCVCAYLYACQIICAHVCVCAHA